MFVCCAQGQFVSSRFAFFLLFFSEGRCAHLFAVLHALHTLIVHSDDVNVVSGVGIVSDMLTHAQWIKRSTRAKIVTVMRHRPLLETVECLPRLVQTLCISPVSIYTGTPPKYCVCRGAEHGEMVQCSAAVCTEWYHVACLEEEDRALARDDADWRCPFCTNGTDDKGKQTWKKGAGKSKKRLAANAPGAQGVGADDAREATGAAPRGFQEKLVQVQIERRRLLVETQKKKGRVGALRKELGHHVGDMVRGGELIPQGVSMELIDAAEEQGYDLLQGMDGE